MSIRVLVVEDNPLNMELVLAILEDFGEQLSVTVAGDGHEGLQRFLELKPQIVLLDMQLPGIDGFTLARRFKEINAASIIVGLTAYGMVGDKERVLEAGCDYYLAKPLEVAEFKHLMKVLMETEGLHEK